MLELTIFLVALVGFYNALYFRKIAKKLEQEIAEIDGVLEGLIDALREDADADYQHRIDRMFQYLTEDLDEE